MSQEYNISKIRADFPLLATKTRNGKPLVYLDNAATSQKPQSVIDAITAYYNEDNANIHRAVYELSERATRHYEEARVKIQQFINAKHSHEVIFVRGATEGINLVASTWGRKNIHEGDEIIITAMEHHANIVPWQMLCEETGARLRVIPIDDSGDLIFDEYVKLLNDRTKLVAVTQMSNVLGTVVPVKEITKLAHERGIPVLVDGAQAIYHTKIDVQDIDCDFFVFSGHKFYGPTGIGILYGKSDLLNAMPPYQGGGDMIASVTFEKTTYNALPYKFEAGTPNIEGAIGLGAAVDYVSGLGIENIADHESKLLSYATEKLTVVKDLTLIGTAPHKASVLSFLFGDIHPHDVGTILDREGVCVRTGHHCAQPVMKRFGIPATTRASLACYNTEADIDALVLGLEQVRAVFG